MLGKERKTKSIDSKQDKFLLKLYEILEKDEYSKIIHWSQNGSYIVITNIHLLSKKILPIYFNHQNYSSFVRQLNMYNFHKIRTDPDKQEQYFINEFLNQSKTIKDIQNFKRKEKSKQKCLFFQDEDSKIKYTILNNKKDENKNNDDNNSNNNNKDIKKENKDNKKIKKPKKIADPNIYISSVNNQNNFYIVCPKCKLLFPEINDFSYDNDKKDFNISYTCECSKELHKSYLVDFLNKNKPFELNERFNKFKKANNLIKEAKHKEDFKGSEIIESALKVSLSTNGPAPPPLIKSSIKISSLGKTFHHIKESEFNPINEEEENIVER